MVDPSMRQEFIKKKITNPLTKYGKKVLISSLKIVDQTKHIIVKVISLAKTVQDCPIIVLL